MKHLPVRDRGRWETSLSASHNLQVIHINTEQNASPQTARVFPRPARAVDNDFSFHIFWRCVRNVIYVYYMNVCVCVCVTLCVLGATAKEGNAVIGQPPPSMIGSSSPSITAQIKAIYEFRPPGVWRFVFLVCSCRYHFPTHTHTHIRVRISTSIYIMNSVMPAINIRA